MADLIPVGGNWFDHATSMNRRAPLPNTQMLRPAEPPRKGAGGEFIHIRHVVRGVVRAHGIPHNCRIDFATIGQQGCGCAGFDDAPASFERPFVLLDKTIYEKVDRHELLPVYCGIGLHEAGHILHSREMYRRLAAGMSDQRKTYENLWEDERVEELVRAASPGFSGYLTIAKLILLEEGEPGRALEDWAMLVDVDRVNALIFAFIRFPHRIPATIQEWTAINGECVFETLRSLTPRRPRDEADVAEFAERFETLWQRLRQIYPSTADEARHWMASRGASDEELRRIAEQLAADVEDSASSAGAPPSGVDSSKSDSSQPVPQRVDHMLAAAVEIDAIGRSCPVESARRIWREIAEKIVQRAIQIESGADTESDRDRKRFSVRDFARIVEDATSVQGTLDETESAALATANCSEVSHTDLWEWDSTRITTVMRPDTVEEAAVRRYDEALERVRPQIQVMRAAFSSLRGRDVPVIERDLYSGALDTRRLVPAAIGKSRRVFKRRTEIPAMGIAVALLLDESGSMSGAKAEATLEVAVMLAEALRGIPQIELEVYSHTTSDEDDRNCLIRQLAGKRMRDHRAIGDYAADHMGGNYDHQAILTVAKLFRQATRFPKRWLLVVSDGQPSGTGYGGEPAVIATRDAVRAVRRQGMCVMNVAVEAYGSEEIYGDSWVLRFTDMPRLVDQFRRLLVRLARGA